MERLIETAVAAGLPVVVLGSLLAAGTVHVPVLLLLAPICLALGILALWLDARRGRDIPHVALVLFGLGVYSAFQALPLPAGWMQILSPASAETWQESLRLIGPQPQWMSISLDPGASVVEGLKWVSYGAVFVAAARVGRRHGSFAGPLIVFAAAAIAAVTTVVHGAVGATKLFGLYEPSYSVGRWAISPLLNPNNYSGYLNLGAFCGIGLLVSHKARVPRPFVAVALAAILGVSTILASRGGLVSLLAGLVCLVPVLAWLMRRHGNRTVREIQLTMAVPVGAVALSGLLLAVLGGGTEKWQRLLDESMAKLQVLERTLPMIRDYFFLGAGRGAFETVFPAYAQGGGNEIYQYAENFVEQWSAEWGVPLTAVALGSLTWLLRPTQLGVHRSLAAAAAFVGVVVLLGQNLLDLALEVPAVCLALATLLGSLSGAAEYRRTHSPTRASWRDSSNTQDSIRSRTASSERYPFSGTAARVALVAVLVALSLLVSAFAWGTHPALVDRDRLHRLATGALSATAARKQKLWDLLKESVRRHPADPYFFVLGAHATRRDPSRRALAWAGRAIERSSSSGEPYYALALNLADYGAQRQALHALRTAATIRPEMAGRITKAALRMTNEPSELEQVAPHGSAGASILFSMAQQLRGPERAALRENLRWRALRRDPAHVGARTEAVKELHAGLTAGSERCSKGRRSQCLEEIESHLRVLEAGTARNGEVLILRARWLLERDRPLDAYAWLTRTCRQAKDLVPCLRERVAVAREIGDQPSLQDSIDAYLSEACLEVHGCSAAAMWVGDIRASRSEWSDAADQYERAAHAVPSVSAWTKVAQAANRAGMFPRAVMALRHADRLRRGQR